MTNEEIPTEAIRALQWLPSQKEQSKSCIFHLSDSVEASRVVFWSRHCVPYRPSHISSSVCIPDPSYLSLFKVHVIYAQLAQVREGFCSL